MAGACVDRITPRGRALVIEAGVSGLTTALCLRGAGFDVSVVAEKFATDIVSVVAGALWEWPPAACGHHLDPTSLERSKAWCMDSYRVFSDLARGIDAGVILRHVVFYFRSPVAERPRDLARMNELLRITIGHCVAHEPESREQDMIFIIPGGRNMLLLGGITEAHEWGLDIVLAGARLDEPELVRVGLRPFRVGVRLEHGARHLDHPQLRPRRIGPHVLLGLRPRGRRHRKAPGVRGCSSLPTSPIGKGAQKEAESQQPEEYGRLVRVGGLVSQV